jgi:dTDP-4-dehydrorhamnose 3,5-epimerase
MQFETNEFEGVFIIKPRVFEDERGYFFESFNKNVFKENGLNIDFVQDNESLSQKNVLRGMHFQRPPYAQGKLIRVIQGSVLDVAVDIRKTSKTYGQYFRIELSAKNKTMIYIPTGFAHGFLTLEDNTIFSYKCTNFFNKESEDALLWNDEEIGIDWGIKTPILSDKDKKAQLFNSYNTPF